MNIPYTKHTLSNGLDVLIHEDHAVPIVAVNLWYHVGSKNEVPGRTGFAHLFEHLMFEGSQHYDRGYFHPLQEAGASLNGSTNADRTNYWETVPTNALDLALYRRVRGVLRAEYAHQHAAVEDAFGCGYPRDAAAALLIEVNGLREGLDAQADRKAGTLVVNAIHEDVRFTRAMAAAVRAEIEDLALWLGLRVTGA